MMKPKKIQIDVLATANKLVAKWQRDLRRVGAHVGNVELNVGNDVAEVIVETDAGVWLADQMSSDLSKVEYTKIIGITKCPGHFDWKSDTYIKDAVVLHFAMAAQY